jgi:PPP family 3-phenylpropionic acid transporter
VDYVNRQVPAEWRATGQSLFGAASMGAGGILGNTWAGFLYDRLGIQGMYRVNGFIIVAVALVAIVALRDKRPDPDKGDHEAALKILGEQHNGEQL